MQRPEASIREPGNAEIKLGPEQLRGDQRANAHADHTPDDGHHGELPDDLVVVGGYCGSDRGGCGSHAKARGSVVTPKFSGSGRGADIRATTRGIPRGYVALRMRAQAL